MRSASRKEGSDEEEIDYFKDPKPYEDNFGEEYKAKQLEVTR